MEPGRKQCPQCSIVAMAEWPKCRRCGYQFVAQSDAVRDATRAVAALVFVVVLIELANDPSAAADVIAPRALAEVRKRLKDRPTSGAAADVYRQVTLERLETLVEGIRPLLLQKAAIVAVLAAEEGDNPNVGPLQRAFVAAVNEEFAMLGVAEETIADIGIHLVIALFKMCRASGLRPRHWLEGYAKSMS